MKTRTRIAGTLTAAVVLVGGLALPAAAGAGNGNGGGHGNGPGNGSCAGQHSSESASPGHEGQALPQGAALTADQQAELTFWIEEEKMARDLYQALGERYPELGQFDRIARAEQKHLDAVARLLGAYGGTDPTVDTAAGVFTDPALTAMYNELLASATTAEAALAAGATVERKDIADLTAAKELFDQTDVLRVLNAQIRASERHLRAFTR